MVTHGSKRIKRRKVDTSDFIYLSIRKIQSEKTCIIYLSV